MFWCFRSSSLRTNASCRCDSASRSECSACFARLGSLLVKFICVSISCTASSSRPICRLMFSMCSDSSVILGISSGLMGAYAVAFSAALRMPAMQVMVSFAVCRSCWTCSGVICVSSPSSPNM